MSKTGNTPTSEEWDSWKDFKQSIGLMFHASYLQFSRPASWVIGGIGAAGLAYTLEEDKRLMLHYNDHGPTTLQSRLSNDWSMILNFPTIPITAYAISRAIKDSKLKNFSIEYFATMYLTMLEASIFSVIDVHDRPSNANLSKWETEFRAESSFPSGHILGMSTLFFKTLQYYGPAWATIPAIATYMVSRERMASKKHYSSDIWGSLLLSALASEGTKIANNRNTHRHPVYKWIYEHDLSVLAYPSDRGTMLSLKMSY